jgi:hypothetical protein
LPTVHGFDEFFGNLYHLNTEEEPEDVDYPADPAFKAAHATRGVLHCPSTLRRRHHGQAADASHGGPRALTGGNMRITSYECAVYQHMKLPLIS